MHLKGKLSIMNNSIALLRKLRHSLPKRSLLSIYKTFSRPHLIFVNTVESIQYNADLAITCTINETTKEVDYLKDR